MTVKVKILDTDWSEELHNHSENLMCQDNFSLLKIDETINVYMMEKSLCGCYSLALNPSEKVFCVAAQILLNMKILTTELFGFIQNL